MVVVGTTETTDVYVYCVPGTVPDILHTLGYLILKRFALLGSNAILTLH